MDVGQRIQLLRVKYNMTQKDLSEKIKVSVVSVGGWECGSRYPSAEAIVALAQVFNTTTDYLLGVSINQHRDEELLSQQELALVSNYRLLDKYGRQAVDAICHIECLRIKSAHKNKTISLRNIGIKASTRYIPKYITPSAAGFSAPLDGDDFEMILADDAVPSDADFAVRIQGDSMNPYICDGDTVYVKRCSELSIGDIGIFCVDGAMYCKQYYIDSENNLILLSANEKLKHTNIIINQNNISDVKCYGKVIIDDRVDIPSYIYSE